MSDKLRPCPFCGSTTIIDKYVYMQCGNCNAKGPTVNNGINDDHADHFDHERAIERWNKRR